MSLLLLRLLSLLRPLRPHPPQLQLLPPRVQQQRHSTTTKQEKTMSSPSPKMPSSPTWYVSPQKDTEALLTLNRRSLMRTGGTVNTRADLACSPRITRRSMTRFSKTLHSAMGHTMNWKTANVNDRVCAVSAAPIGPKPMSGVASMLHCKPCQGNRSNLDRRSENFYAWPPKACESESALRRC